MSSHALLLSPDVSTPATNRSTATTPGGVSPAPAASGRPSLQGNHVATAAGAVAPSAGAAAATANLPGVLGTAAAAAEAWRQQQQQHGDAAAGRSVDETAQGKFHAMRQAVDSAADPMATAPPPPPPPPPPAMADCRTVSIFGGAVPGIDAAAEAAIAAEAAAAAAEGDGEGGGAAAGAGSELSFSAMLRPGSKKG